MGEKGQGHDAKAASLVALNAARVAREEAERAELTALTSARAAGASWARIGELYGLTKQGAQQRFKRSAQPAVKEGVPE